jgi:predicted ATPase
VTLVQGEIDGALDLSARSLDLARELTHPFTLAFALHHAALTRQQRGDRPETLALVRELLALATDEGFPFWQTMAEITRGGERMRDGDLDQALQVIEQGIAMHRLMGADIGSTYWLALLAECHARRGARGAALEVVERVLSLVEAGQERLWEAELHRLRGDVLLGAFTTPDGSPPADRRTRDAAAASFERALAVARARGARLWELRAATRLARLSWGSSGTKRAIDLLTPLADAFTEGHDAADVRAATSLLHELRGGAARAPRGGPPPRRR